jgi:hypothetical protein
MRPAAVAQRLAPGDECFLAGRLQIGMLGPLIIDGRVAVLDVEVIGLFTGLIRLIERLAMGAGDDHPQALLTKALGELHSLSSCILFGRERSCYPIDVDGADNVHHSASPGLLRPGTYQLPLEPSVR